MENTPNTQTQEPIIAVATSDVVVTTSSKDIGPLDSFASLNLPAALAKALVRMEYNTPTPIQAAAIPLAMAGRDILGTAQTGTGKTAAFAIPIIARLLSTPRGSAIVLLPTRELAVQVMGIMKQLLEGQSAIKAALLIGGESMPPQLRALSARPRLIIGTPGRIIDHLKRGSLMLHDAGFLVLDETDRMLDMGFGVQLEAILPYLAKQRQTLMFSATMPKEIVALSSKYLVNPERVSMGAVSKPVQNLVQEVVHMEESEKYTRLVKELQEREGSIIVFVKTKRSADKLTARLSAHNMNADAIHGDLRQHQRDRAIRDFRSGKTRILIATDIAARGLDIPHIKHVINHDLPQCAEDFIHRIGRTARAGADGACVSFVTREESRKWVAIERLLNPDAPRKNPMPPREANAPAGKRKRFGGGGYKGKRAGGSGGGGGYKGGNKESSSGGNFGGGYKGGNRRDGAANSGGASRAEGASSKPSFRPRPQRDAA